MIFHGFVCFPHGFFPMGFAHLQNLHRKILCRSLKAGPASYVALISKNSCRKDLLLWIVQYPGEYPRFMATCIYVFCLNSFSRQVTSWWKVFILRTVGGKCHQRCDQCSSVRSPKMTKKKGALMRLKSDVAGVAFDKARLVKGSAPGSWFAQFWEDSWKLEELAHEWLPNFSGDGVGDGAMETQIMSDNLWLTSTEYFPQKWSSFAWKSPCRLTDDMEYGLPSSPVVCSFERHAVSLFGRSLSRYAYYQHTLYVWTSGSMM